MGDHQGGAVLRQFLQRGLHGALGFGVERGGGLVEQQQRRIAQDGPRDGQALALAARQAHALLAEKGGEALGQGVEEFQRIGGARRLPHVLVRSVGPAIADIVPGRGGEDHRILRHQPDLPADVGRIGVAQIDAVEADGAVLGIVEAQQQLQDSAFSGAGRPHQRHRLAGRHRQGEAVQRRFVGPRRIMEGDGVERDSPGSGEGDGFRLGRRLDVGGGGQQFQQPLGGAGGALHVADHLGQGADRDGGQDGVENEGGQFAAGHAAGDHVIAADPQNHRHRAEGQHDDDGRQQRPGADAEARGVEGLVDDGREILAVDRFVGIGLGGADGVDGLLGEGRDVGDPVLALAREFAYAPAEQHDRGHHRRYHDQHQPGQFEAGHRQHHQRAGHGQHIAQRHRQGGADHRLQQLGVGGQARQHLAGLGGLEISRRKRDHPAEHGGAQIGHHPLADPGDQIEARRRRQGEHGGDDDEADDRLVQQDGVALLQALVDDMAQSLAEQQHGQGRHHECYRGAEQAAAVWPQEG